MAVIRDVMPAFELFQPTSINDALTILNRHGSDAWVMAGGLDLRLAEGSDQATNVVIDLSQMNELRGVKEVGGGVEIGADDADRGPARHQGAATVASRSAPPRRSRKSPGIWRSVTSSGC